MGLPCVSHVIVYSDWALIATACDPVLVVRESPGPVTVQLFPARTSVAFQEIVDEPPIDTREGDAEMVICGCITVTVAEAEADREAFEHVI